MEDRREFLDRLGFAPDQFQTESFDALDAGHNVIVAAPTGAGKTLIASYAVDQALQAGRRVFLHHSHQGAFQSEIPRLGS